MRLNESQVVPVLRIADYCNPDRDVTIVPTIEEAVSILRKRLEEIEDFANLTLFECTECPPNSNPQGDLYVYRERSDVFSPDLLGHVTMNTKLSSDMLATIGAFFCRGSIVEEFGYFDDDYLGDFRQTLKQMASAEAYDSFCRDIQPLYTVKDLSHKIGLYWNEDANSPLREAYEKEVEDSYAKLMEDYYKEQ